MAVQYDANIAGQAWDQIASGIQGASAELASLRTDFVKIITEGQTFRKFDRELQRSLARIEWTWPWFEEWATTFATWEMSPFMWPELTPEPEEIDDYTPEELASLRREAIAPLISHTAAAIAYRNMHIAKAQPHHKWRLVHMNDPAEMRAASTHEDAILAGDLSVIPPFFPGDRTSLQNIGPFRMA